MADIDTSGSARDPHRSRADLLSRAEAAFHSGDVARADRLYARVLQADPDLVPALIGKAVTGTRLRGATADALALLDRATARAPAISRIPQTRAAILNEIGDFEGAVTAARQALAIDPRCALAYVNLTDSTKIRPGDPIFDTGGAALSDPALPDRDRILIHFALGKAHQDCGAHNAAFDLIDRGNRLKPPCRTLDHTRRVVDRQKSLFSPAFCTTLTGATRTTPRPIFIVGMPRSGTTLLERMLAAHPDIATAGERSELNRISGEFSAKAQSAQPDHPPVQAVRKAMTRASLANVARAYLTPVARAAGLPRCNVIDKNPLNFWNIGLIAATFADAPILHLRRDPRDTCLSNYFANYRSGLEFSNRLDSLGRYFRLYDELMRHWDAVLPGRICHVDYERLVRSPEPALRQILSACGLDWDDACLSPERTPGRIATASRYQARQQISSGSVGKWQRYALHLGPLIDALGGTDWIAAYNAARGG